MRKFGFGKSKMPCVDAYANECRAWISDAARHRSGPRKAVLAQIAREVGLEAGRIVSLFYGKVRSPSAAEWDALRQWQAQHRAREMDRLRRRLQEMEMSRDS